MIFFIFIVTILHAKLVNLFVKSSFINKKIHIIGLRKKTTRIYTRFSSKYCNQYKKYTMAILRRERAILNYYSDAFTFSSYPYQASSLQ